MKDNLYEMVEHFAKTCEKTIDFKRQTYHSLSVRDGSGKYKTTAKTDAMKNSFPLWIYQFAGSLIYLTDSITRDNEKYLFFCFDNANYIQFLSLAQQKMNSKTTYQFNTNTQKGLDDTTKMKNFESFLGVIPGTFLTHDINGRTYVIQAFRSIRGKIKYSADTEDAKKGVSEFLIGDNYDVDYDDDINASYA